MCACGGIVHRHFVDENYDSLVLSHECSNDCGDPSERCGVVELL